MRFRPTRTAEKILIFVIDRQFIKYQPLRRVEHVISLMKTIPQDLAPRMFDATIPTWVDIVGFNDNYGE